jgi:hypothetical protein
MRLESGWKFPGKSVFREKRYATMGMRYRSHVEVYRLIQANNFLEKDELSIFISPVE